MIDRDLAALYNTGVFEWAAMLGRTAPLAAPDVRWRRASPICGSRIAIELVVDGDRVADYAHQVQACVLGQASASILATHIVGATRTDLSAAADGLRAMLRGDGSLPAGPWADLNVLAAVRDHAGRHPAILLPFDAVLEGWCLFDGNTP